MEIETNEWPQSDWAVCLCVCLLASNADEEVRKCRAQMAAAAVVVVLMGIDISTALPLLFDILLSLLRRQLFIPILLLLLGPKIQLVRKQTKCFCEAAAAAAGASE